MATKIFTYDFEVCCNLKPLEPLPAGASEIARGVYRMPVGVGGDALVKVADHYGVTSTNAYVKRQWQYYFNIRTLGNSRPVLFAVAALLTLINAFVLTGAIVSTVYTFRLARFAAMETFEYGHRRISRPGGGDRAARAGGYGPGDAGRDRPRAAHGGRGDQPALRTIAARTLRTDDRPRHAPKTRL